MAVITARGSILHTYFFNPLLYSQAKREILLMLLFRLVTIIIHREHRECVVVDFHDFP
jgi:hypothetical protein